MQKLIETISRNCSLPPHDVEQFLSRMEEVSFRRGEHIISAGSRNSSLYIVKSGIWRAWRCHEGRESTIWFASEGTTAFSVWGYVAGGESRITLEAETDSMALVMPRSRVDELCAASAAMANVVRHLFEYHAWEIESDMLIWTDNISAKQRYLYLIEKYPELARSITVKKLASFLLITPQSLSRIRREVARQKPEQQQTGRQNPSPQSGNTV